MDITLITNQFHTYGSQDSPARNLLFMVAVPTRGTNRHARRRQAAATEIDFVARAAKPVQFFGNALPAIRSEHGAENQLAFGYSVSLPARRQIGERKRV